jgi:AcrR family transcriptional regulator
VASQPEPKIETRSRLNRERVLRAAVALADQEGIQALSMRRLARELGVEAMSLYNHVANKDDILDGMLDIVTGEIEVPTDGVDWKASLRLSAISAYDALIRHPWACSLMHATPRVSDARMLWMEGVLRTLREAGFSAELTHHAYHALDSHITGFTLWLVSMPFDSHEELVDMAKTFLPKISADEYPYIIEHAQQHMEEPDPDEPTEFEFGLDLILDGLERLRDAEPD